MMPSPLLDALRVAWNAAPAAQDVLDECECWRGDEAMVDMAMRLVRRHVMPPATTPGEDAVKARNEAFLLDLGMAQLSSRMSGHRAAQGALDLVGIMAAVEAVAGMQHCTFAQSLRAGRRVAEMAEGLQARTRGGDSLVLDGAALRGVLADGPGGASAEMRTACGWSCDKEVTAVLFGAGSRIDAEAVARAAGWLMQRRGRLPEGWRARATPEPGQGDWPPDAVTLDDKAQAGWDWREGGEARLPRMLADLLSALVTEGYADSDGKASAALGAALLELAPAQAMRCLNTALDTMIGIGGGMAGTPRAMAKAEMAQASALPAAALVHCLGGMAEMCAAGREHRLLLPGGLMLAGQRVHEITDTDRRHRGVTAANGFLEAIQQAGGGWDAEAWGAHGQAVGEAARAVAEGCLRAGQSGDATANRQLQALARRAGAIVAMAQARHFADAPAGLRARRRG